MINIKNTIKESLLKENPALDTRDGSVISDILIEPLTYLLNQYELNVKNELVVNSFKDPVNLAEDTLDKLASFFLLERTTGTKATGEIYLYFNSPVSLSIYNGTIFVSRDSNLEFETTQDFIITKTTMVYNYESGYYFMGPIPVIAKDYGDKYSLYKDTLFNINTRLVTNPVKIQNKVDFTVGVNKESNLQLFDRLKRTLYGSSLSSPTNIRNTILNADPTIAAIEIIGANSPYMWRDLIVGSADVDSFAKETFLYTRSGEHDGPTDVKHSAWSNNIVDVDPTDEVEFPDVDTWVQEASDNDYRSIALLDANYLEQKQSMLVYDFYNITTAGAIALHEHNILAGKPWKFNDAALTNGLKSLDEITLGASDGLVLGATDAEQLAIPVSIMLALRNGTMSNEEFLNWMSQYNVPENENNFYPIVHRELSQNLGLAVEFTFKTTDNTEEGRICYATTRRNKTKFYAHDGFGLAFKKQPQYLIRMQKNSYGNNTQLRSEDLLKFSNEYNVSQTEASSYLGDIINHKEFWKFNVFLVDNNAITEEISINYENLIETSTGINQFVQATKVWIEPNINYYVKYFIYEGMGFKAWISTTANSFTDTNNVLYKGQSYPEYVQVTGSDNFDVITGEFSENPNRNSFGFSVLNTKNYTWNFKDLKIYSIVESLPMQLFRFYIDPLRYNISSGSLILDYYGMAFDETLMLPEYTGNRSNLKLGIFNYNTTAWETIDYITYDPYPQIYGNTPLVLDDIKINHTIEDIGNYLNADGYLAIAAAAANSGSEYTLNKQHTLRTYYVEIRNGDPIEKHRGNCTDIYCYDPKNIKRDNVTAVLDTTEIYTNQVGGFKGYALEITRIEEFYSGVELPASSYTIINMDRGDTYSNSANYKISFNTNSYVGARIKIHYKYWTNGAIINNLVVNSDIRFPSADYKVKTMPNVVISIDNLRYAGGLELVNMKAKLAEFINSNLTQFDKSDLVNVLYTNGANYVDLDMDVKIREYNLFNVPRYKTLDNQTYVIPNTMIARLYTDLTELEGVTKI